MVDVAEAQQGTLEEPGDAGLGPAGTVKRWMTELELADKAEKAWRKEAQDVIARYRDEKADSVANSTGSRYQSGNRFNILYSNIKIIVPAVYNQTPKPDVRRRYRDRDETGKIIADVMERGLSFVMDENDLDRALRQAVKDCQLPGRGVTRVRYDATYAERDDGQGGTYDDKVFDDVLFEHVNWADFRIGPGKTWEDVTWIAFRHCVTKKSGMQQFPDTFADTEYDYTPQGLEDEQDGNPIVDTFKRVVVWEIWDKDAREVIFIAPSLKERPLKKEDDPLGLKQFFPVPRPLYANDDTDSLVPIPPFRIYRDQADELDGITKRISAIVKALRVRAIYDSRVGEINSLMTTGDAVMVPAEDVITMFQNGGLEKAIWFWPIEKIAGVLVHLYNQREAIKTTIYEITGIADIMRGSTAASETLGAQQLKAQFGSMRLDDMRKEVQRYARDLVRMAAEIMAEHFSADTMAVMTMLELPSGDQKKALMEAAKRLQMEQKPVPKKLQKELAKPTWEEAMTVLRDDRQRAYRIDIETDSTVSGDQQADQQAITELLTGISTFIQNAGPAVAEGYLPLESAKSMLMTAVRRFKMGREVEDALDMIGEGEDEEGPSQEQQQIMQQMQAMQEQFQQLAGENQQLAQENEAMKRDKSQEAEKAASELQFKERELAQKFEFEAGQRALDRQADMQKIALQKLEVDPDTLTNIAMGTDIPKQTEIIVQSLTMVLEGLTALSNQMQGVAMQMQETAAAAKARKVVTRDENGLITGVEIVPPEMTVN